MANGCEPTRGPVDGKSEGDAGFVGVGRHPGGELPPPQPAAEELGELGRQPPSNAADPVRPLRRRVDAAASGTDGVLLYLRAIAKTPLLTPDEEVELFQRFEAATRRVTELFNQFPTFILEPARRKSGRGRGAKPKPPPGRWWTPMEIGAILKRIEAAISAAQDGQTGEIRGWENPVWNQEPVAPLWNQLTAAVEAMEAVREKIVKANLLLVASVAAKHSLPISSLSFLDLMQEGSIGLMKAVEKFDPQRGCRFSTYATWWIMQTIKQALAQQSRTIRVPPDIGAARRQIWRAQTRLAADLEREPSLGELASAVALPESRVREILRGAKGTISLFAPANGAWPDETICDRMADESQATPEEEALRVSERETIDKALDTLTRREKLVIQLRYGLADGTEHSLAQTGLRLGVSRERVRQIQEGALRKLGRPARKRYLRELL